MAGATIKIFLPTGEAESLRVAEISNWTGKALAAPRSELEQALEREEMSQSGIYFLIGRDPDTDKPVAYIVTLLPLFTPSLGVNKLKVKEADAAARASLPFASLRLCVRPHLWKKCGPKIRGFAPKSGRCKPKFLFFEMGKQQKETKETKGTKNSFFLSLLSLFASVKKPNSGRNPARTRQFKVSASAPFLDSALVKPHFLSK